MKYLSVIVPVYNAEDHLEKCLDSIINQTFKDLEIILVNDGSTDNSAKICDNYVKKDARIKVIHQQNSGVSAARNRGIDIAAGDYITFVDSDDWLEPQMYEKMCEVSCLDVSVDIVMCDFLNIKKSEKVEIPSNLREGFYNKKQIICELYPTLLVTEEFGRIPIVSVWSCFFKRSLLINDKTRFDASLMFSEDYLFMADSVIKANSFYYLKGNYLYNYLQYEESRSKRYEPIWWDNLVYLNKKLDKLLKYNKDYDFTRQIKLKLLHSAFYTLNYIYKNENMIFSAKLQATSVIFNEPELQEVFINLNLEKQFKTQRIALFFIKHKMAFTYLVFMRLISTLKNA